MAYVPVPKDLTAVKTKVLLNLTKRQLICFGGGALIGIPLFFLLKGPANLSASGASLCMVLVMMPFFLMAVYEKNGLPLEKIVRNIVRVLFLRPKQRPYQTNNYYAALTRQSRLDKEVRDIVRNTQKDVPAKGKVEGYHRSAESKHPKCDRIKERMRWGFAMRKYDKEFKEEAVKLSDEIGVKQAAAQLGIPYYSLAEWRQKRKAFGDHAFVGSGIRRDAPLSENERRLIKEITELRKANEILKDALGFFAKDRKR